MLNPVNVIIPPTYAPVTFDASFPLSRHVTLPYSVAVAVPDACIRISLTSSVKPSPPPPSEIAKSKTLIASPSVSAETGKSTGSVTPAPAVTSPSESCAGPTDIVLCTSPVSTDIPEQPLSFIHEPSVKSGGLGYEAVVL